ncbi:Aste57867_19352 [Aphanomyces stellatus]|uniref:Aste57867_19352 protein n=1 Tax=Aphanomyces stellatus TaxID=120398 RepID=A0A485LE90_9STRA|nr:hypothetical protein As57867_019288 [Aphanomyces stellatus]VFT96066.1 Aste57867_19352 [Aphanomyces stellatus]
MLSLDNSTTSNATTTGSTTSSAFSSPYSSCSSPASPGQTSTASSDDGHHSSHHHHHFGHTNQFSQMLNADIKTLQSEITTSFHVPPEMKCQYKTGTCTNMRTTKKNGKLLMLCELHRKKQNEIKKRSDRKQSAMRMNRRLEAKQKVNDKIKTQHIPSAATIFKSRPPKFEELLTCDPSQVWEHHHHHTNNQSAAHHHHHNSGLDTLPALTLPRVNVWRTKDGIATGMSNNSFGSHNPSKSFVYQNPFSPGGAVFDWSTLPSTVVGNITPRGNDLAILEFFLDD